MLERVPGPWDNPEGIVRDRAGRIFIADTSGDRVVSFDPKTGAQTSQTIDLPVCLADTPRGVVVTARTTSGAVLALVGAP